MLQILTIILIIIIIHFKSFMSKKEKRSRGEIFMYFIKLAAMLLIVPGLPFYLIYHSIIFDIEDGYKRHFETPIEYISDLEGYGVGFLDGYAQFAFRSNKIIALKHEDTYITVVDSIEKDKIIKDLIIKFTRDWYEKYFESIRKINVENSVLKIHYRDSVSIDRKYLFLKNENIHLFTISY
ncbi:TPA: hypothetical protein DCR49_06610 [Candidatus Delongbacteria bacterium]|nr:MAG: hypothetical protein A2Y39_06430 [Candidatus Delongbacteria bacterium GWF2_40_14]HAQ61656.1 hypothetical protein [Candidatus Delongbacteria bacterium]